MIRDGFYTVAYKQGEERGHRTFKLETQAQDSNFAPGKQVIYYLMGSNNMTDYRGMGFVVDGALVLWKKYQNDKTMSILVQCANLLVDGQHAAAWGKRYSVLTCEVLGSAKCYICNHDLTTPESVRAGIGPICAGLVVKA